MRSLLGPMDLTLVVVGLRELIHAFLTANVTLYILVELKNYVITIQSFLNRRSFNIFTKQMNLGIFIWRNETGITCFSSSSSTATVYCIVFIQGSQKSAGSGRKRKGRWKRLKKRWNRKGVVEVDIDHHRYELLNSIREAIRDLITKQTELGPKAS